MFLLCLLANIKVYMINDDKNIYFLFIIYTLILAKGRVETLYIHISHNIDTNILIIINHIHPDLSQKAEWKHYTFILAIKRK